MFGKGRNMTKNPYGAGERLNTIEEEEKQYETQSNIFKTGERKHNKSNSAFTKSNRFDQTLSKGVLSEPGDINTPDSRKRLDDDDSALDDPPMGKRVKSNNDMSFDDEYE